ncbi:MAG: prolyl-tRNA synthetase associated domain-containing protein [Rhodospirillaceae bacterium]|jgi:Ala-tRNA(Pro) deacylase|nr:prolyl-tRNA synthetase associated domain-containing protein [Rhodospirillaceae bacterium]MBT5241959.1 prolyl-tRNA synthetase associated domain-containing protein [Rhodospirillaceae bacterium]MBT5567397.1 prolyl-tRNA synthetase associated domain-containing protein [Rhodospirillaceae bacterium]MBT6089499.1 prolyl-tRNA synthetase associated domain-containing protein [Rhodospirillaceae bacterium]MBT6960560.1 prolyl-tRNA synthetase associated domain-containing protein [Rhodospirillaceae bacterium
MPATPDDLLDRLAALEIATTTVDHPPAFTVEDGEAYVGHLPGVHVKNLFLCDAKKKMWLVTVPWDQTIDLKGLPTLIDSKRLSFGSPDRLLRTLGVTPGSVSPFCVINDSDATVQVVLDAWMMEQALINAHPLINSKTTTIEPTDLLKFMRACGHAPRIVDFRKI